MNLAGSWYWNWRQNAPPELPLEAMAKVTAQHARLSAKLVRDMAALHDTATWRDLRSTDLYHLSNAARPTVPRIATALEVASETVSKLERDMDSPHITVSSGFFNIAFTIKELVSQFKSIARSEGRNYQAEENVGVLFKTFLTESAENHLRNLQRLLDIASERSEIIAHQYKNTHLSVLPSVLGLERPSAWLFWRRRAFDNSMEVQNRLRMVENVKKTFEAAQAYADAVEVVRETLKEYLDTEGIFQTADVLDQSMPLDSGIDFEQWIDAIAEPLAELDTLTRRARAQVHS